MPDTALIPDWSDLQSELDRLAGEKFAAAFKRLPALEEELDRLRDRLSDNPFANPVKLMSARLFYELDQGDLTLDEVDGLVQVISARRLVERAGRARAYMIAHGADGGDGDGGITGNFIDRLRGYLVGDGDAPSFDDFKRRVERAPVGLVMTAHPTFGLAADLYQAAMELVYGEDGDGRPLDGEGRRARLGMLLTRDHVPDAEITLDTEFDQAAAAIGRAADALRAAMRAMIDIARETYPDRWTELNPRPMTLASWVGFDIDGRTDIGWTSMFRKRIAVASAQMRRYLSYAEGLHRQASAMDGGTDLAAALDAVKARLGEGLDVAEQEIAAFDCQAGDIDAVMAAAASLAENDGRRLADPKELVGAVDGALKTVGSLDGGPAARELVADLVVFRAEIANSGLALAQPHVRLNASQVFNAYRHATEVEADPDDPAGRRVLLRLVGESLDRVKTETFNLGSVTAERTSARRLFMVVSLFRRYCDAQAPVRFLIAETESAFTLLAALYFARQFGVEDGVEISPLFETPEALEKGADVMAQALQNADFRAYVRAQGRLCVQTGFSDAGRYLGQPAAGLAVERFQIKLAKVMAAEGMTDVQLVIFDTHGESIGRGAHPGSFADRVDYLLSPMARRVLTHRGIAYKHETSFQGGDGFSLFATPASSAAVIAGLLDHIHGAIPLRGDPFYGDSGESLEFFLTLTQFNKNLMNDPDYGRLVLSFADKMTDKSGSRDTKRQSESAAGPDANHLRQIRAIPHNTTLHQLGFLANSVAGVGTAVAMNRDWFDETYKYSDRLRGVISLVYRAHRLSDRDVMAAYVSLYDPGHWLDLAVSSGKENTRDALCRLAAILEEENRHESMRRILRRFERDDLDLTIALDAAEFDRSAATGLGADRATLLHSLRVALIMYTFRQSMRLPRFGDPNLSFEDIIDEVLRLNIATAVENMQAIFPVDVQALDVTGFGGSPTYEAEGGRDYRREHEKLFVPMLRLYRLIKRISTAVNHVIGAHG